LRENIIIQDDNYSCLSLSPEASSSLSHIRRENNIFQDDDINFFSILPETSFIFSYTEYDTMTQNNNNNYSSLISVTNSSEDPNEANLQVII
ncbi:4118_t:CDS:2, partial [Scutellospora calospora]